LAAAWVALRAMNHHEKDAAQAAVRTIRIIDFGDIVRSLNCGKLPERNMMVVEVAAAAAAAEAARAGVYRVRSLEPAALQVG
jgi:hypothetical protein